MVWLTGLVCLVLGVVAGYVMASRMNSAPSKVSELEQKLQDLQRTHDRYREEVSEHFSTTAELVQQMTDSYKDVYQHLASGAQDLCSGEVASKLLPTSHEPVFGISLQNHEGEIQAPKDYAPRLDPAKSGALSEDFGLEKFKDPDKD